MRLETPFGTVDLVDEPGYTSGSIDRTRSYPSEWTVGDSFRASAAHGVLLNDVPLVVLEGEGGATGIHERSAVWLDGRLLVAVGDAITCFRIAPFEKSWRTTIDPVTCFGIHADSSRGALISHGEMTIARFSLDGGIVWSAGGLDIFTGNLVLGAENVEVTDFEGRFYRIDYESGRSEVD